MANKIILKKTSTASKVPLSSDLEVGELAVNLADQKLYSKNAGGTVILVGDGQGTGDVVGGSSSTDNALARYDGTTGKLIQNSVVVVDDSGNMSGVNSITDPDYITFNTGYSTTLSAGQLGWDGNNTLGLGMAGGNVVQRIGEDLFFYCKASSTITKGQVIMFTGAVGASGVPTGAPATGITDGTYIMGIASENIATNSFGLVQAFGTLRNVDTSGYSDGDILWYNPAVTGGLTVTKPSAPNVKVQMCAVINGGSSGGGTILIRINAGSVLGGTDSNVQINGLANGQTLIYDNVAGYWKNANISAGTGVAVTNGAGSISVALATSGVTANTYGSSTAIPVITVDAYGRATSITTASVAGGQYFGNATTKAIAYNSNTIAENVTVTSGNNGYTASPLTINSGYTVTVESGANWIIF